MKKAAELFFFIIIIGISIGLPLVKISFSYKIALSILPVILLTSFYFTNKKLFVPALFFTINAFCSPFAIRIIQKYNLYIPQISFAIPIITYLIIVFLIKEFRNKINWNKKGEFNKTTSLLTVVLIFTSSIALIFWALLIEKDLTPFKKYIPKIPFFLLITYGLIFLIFNSLFEEFMARAVLYDGFSAIFSRITPVILFQAIIFALWHYQGFPGGVIGVIMVFIWSVILGIIRYKAKGMLPPLIAHFFADFTIALILFFVMILPNKYWI